ncbi:hypothetical protein KY361_05850 [Candidatus Woesearchaeota archaeon]|nr:hypothetical protein [Candidatus Woesearchaeota archaeon]
MHLDNLIQSIGEAKGRLLDKIEARGPEFYMKTTVSLDGRLGLYAAGSPGSQEVFVGIQSTDANGREKIEKTVSDRAEPVSTIEGYCSRVGMLVDLLIGSIRPSQRGVQVVGEAGVSDEEKTRIMTFRHERYYPIQELTYGQIKGKEVGVTVGNYKGTIVVSGQGASEMTILRLDVRSASKEAIDACIEGLSMFCTASVEEGDLWISEGYQSVAEKGGIGQFGKDISFALSIFGG